jgi:outer membrane protein TolC
VADTVRSYYGAIAAADTLAAQLQNEHNAARSLEIARALQTGGAATLADVMQAETALHTAEYARIQAEASAKGSTATLSVVMGFDADQSLHLAPTKSADAPAMTAQISDLLAAAARQRPDLAAARDQWSAAGEAVDSARASGRPRISFGAIDSLSTLNGLPQQSGHSIGLTVTVPVFSGFATHYGIRRAEALEAQSAAELKSARVGVS